MIKSQRLAYHVEEFNSRSTGFQRGEYGGSSRKEDLPPPLPP